MRASPDRFLRCAQSEHRAFRAHGFGAEIDAEELVYLIEAKVERLVRVFPLETVRELAHRGLADGATAPFECDVRDLPILDGEVHVDLVAAVRVASVHRLDALDAS